jgi:hypothetical protein
VRALACAAAVLLIVVVTACAARSRPSGPSTPLDNPADLLTQAIADCRGVRTITAELGLSGRAGQQRLRGRVLTGIESPASLRLEGVAPFGPPAFILVARDGRATLLLPRENRVLRDAPPEAIIEALTGVTVTPARLISLLAGCHVPLDPPTTGRLYSNGWAELLFADPADSALLRRVGPTWRLVESSDGLRVTYDDFTADGRPRQITVRPEKPVTTELRLAVSQVEMNTPLEPAAFDVKIPPDAVPLTLDELRRAGPLGEQGTGR